MSDAGIVPSCFAYVVVVAYGLVFGSFLNVVIYRLPREMSLVRPRSHCPSCGALVRWFDNVPLISFLLLGGRCRRCRAPIPWRYPLVEAATAGLLAAGCEVVDLGIVPTPTLQLAVPWLDARGGVAVIAWGGWMLLAALA